MITQKELKEILHYDSETGIFYWKDCKSNFGNSKKQAGTKRKAGYIAINIKGKLYYAHRLAWLWIYGKWPNDLIDHINRDKSDNRLENLRSVTRAENNSNQDKQSGCYSKYIGVTWDKKNQKWQAQISINNKTIKLGRFDSEEEARVARKNAEINYRGKSFVTS